MPETKAIREVVEFVQMLVEPFPDVETEIYEDSGNLFTQVSFRFQFTRISNQFDPLDTYELLKEKFPGYKINVSRSESTGMIEVTIR